MTVVDRTTSFMLLCLQPDRLAKRSGRLPLCGKGMGPSGHWEVISRSVKGHRRFKGGPKEIKKVISTFFKNMFATVVTIVTVE